MGNRCCGDLEVEDKAPRKNLTKPQQPGKNPPAAPVPPPVPPSSTNHTAPQPPPPRMPPPPGPPTTAAPPSAPPLGNPSYISNPATAPSYVSNQTARTQAARQAAAEPSGFDLPPPSRRAPVAPERAPAPPPPAAQGPKSSCWCARETGVCLAPDEPPLPYARPGWMPEDVEALHFATVAAAADYFNPDGKLGEGGQGGVWRGTWSGKQVAVTAACCAGC